MDLLLRKFEGIISNKKDFATLVFSTISIILLIWFTLSFIEIATNNMSSCEYSRLNFFTMFLK